MVELGPGGLATSMARLTCKLNNGPSKRSTSSSLEPVTVILCDKRDFADVRTRDGEVTLDQPGGPTNITRGRQED